MESINLIVSVFFAACVYIALPIYLLISWEKKTRAKLKPALYGAIVCIGFQVLFSLINLPLIKLLGTAKLAATGQYQLLSLTVKYVTDLFYVFFQFMMFRDIFKRYKDSQSAMSCAIGFCGTGGIFTTGHVMLFRFIGFIILSLGGFTLLDKVLSPEALNSLCTSYEGMPIKFYLLNGFEQAISLAFQLSISVFIFKAVWNKKALYFIGALLIKMAVSTILSSLTTFKLVSEAWQKDIIYAIITVVVALFAVRVYKGMKEPVKGAIEDGN